MIESAQMTNYHSMRKFCRLTLEGFEYVKMVTQDLWARVS